MPWSPDDATRFTKKATTAKLKRQWRDVANSELAQHGSEAAAIKAANGVLKRESYQHEFTGKKRPK